MKKAKQSKKQTKKPHKKPDVPISHTSCICRRPSGGNEPAVGFHGHPPESGSVVEMERCCRKVSFQLRHAPAQNWQQEQPLICTEAPGVTQLY